MRACLHNSMAASPHRRLGSFVDWIKPDHNARDAIRDQADNIRQAIKNQARADGLVVVATPNGGSFAKRTGLRRHMRGSTAPITARRGSAVTPTSSIDLSAAIAASIPA